MESEFWLRWGYSHGKSLGIGLLNYFPWLLDTMCGTSLDRCIATLNNLLKHPPWSCQWINMDKKLFECEMHQTSIDLFFLNQSFAKFCPMPMSSELFNFCHNCHPNRPILSKLSSNFVWVAQCSPIIQFCPNCPILSKLLALKIPSLFLLYIHTEISILLCKEKVNKNAWYIWTFILANIYFDVMTRTIIFGITNTRAVADINAGFIAPFPTPRWFVSRTANTYFVIITHSRLFSIYQTMR